MPKLTVLMPVYNGEKFLREAIESVLNQTFGDYEFLIIDDRSQDNSKEIIFSYKDRRIRFIQNKKNLGQMATLNVGIELSRGRYIARMDQDDRSLPERFEKEVEVLDKSDDIGLVYSDSFIIDEHGIRKAKTVFDYTKPPRLPVFNKLLTRNFVTGNTAIIRKDIFEDIGVFNPAYKIAAEYDLFLRLAQKYRVDFIDKQLAEYRVHEGNRSRDAKRTTEEVLAILAALDCRILEKDQKAIVDRTISSYTADLGMYYLFQHNRELCRAKAIKALRVNLFNPKAFAAIFMAVFVPRIFIDYMSSCRRGWLK